MQHTDSNYSPDRIQIPLKRLQGKHGTFKPNRTESIHRWYPYIEGFSSEFVLSLLQKWGNGGIKVYDPFGGAGTTMTVCAMTGRRGYFSEINPFMRLVTEAKTNSLARLCKKQLACKKFLEEIQVSAKEIMPSKEVAYEHLNKAFPNRLYFEEKPLRELLGLKFAIETAEKNKADEDFITVAKLALGSIAVENSLMIRASDLRYRKGKELSKVANGFEAYKDKVDTILKDIHSIEPNFEIVVCASDSAFSNWNTSNQIDIVFTSPPYLNGTNYFRNTKLELWLTGFIECEKDLKRLVNAAMSAGINSISKDHRLIHKYEFVEKIVSELDQVAYDQRIPELVRRYASDTHLWLKTSHDALKKGGRLIIDIGDSRFAGVHVPTDLFITEIAKLIGFEFIEEELIRRRNSKDGTQLKQCLIIIEKK